MLELRFLISDFLTVKKNMLKNDTNFEF
jgi:hypothetical protein